MKNRLALIVLGIGFSCMAFGSEITDVAITDNIDFSKDMFTEPAVVTTASSAEVLFDFSEMTISHECESVSSLPALQLVCSNSLNYGLADFVAPDLPDIPVRDLGLDIVYNKNTNWNPGSTSYMHIAPGWRTQSTVL